MKRKKRCPVLGNPHFPIRGRIRDKVYAVRYGKPYCRDVGDMDWKRFWSSPEFAGSRGSNFEFTAALNLSGTIRWGIGQAASDVGGSKLHSRLVGGLMRLFKHSPGVRGSKVLSVPDRLWMLQHFNLRKAHAKSLFDFGRVYRQNDPISCQPRVHFHFHDANIRVKDFPNGFTYVRPVFSVVAISDLVMDRKSKKYVGKHALHGESRSVVGDLVSLDDLSKPGFRPACSWRPDLVFPEAVEADCGLLCAVGIEFVCLDATGEVVDSHFGALEIAFGGKVPTSDVVKRIFDEVAEIRLRLNGNIAAYTHGVFGEWIDFANSVSESVRARNNASLSVNGPPGETQ